MRYVEAQIQEYRRDLAYRIYVSECLRLIPQNKYLPRGYLDMVKDLDRPKETRTPEKVMIDVMAFGGLKFKDE